MFSLCGAFAQTNVSTRIVTQPNGLYVQVDGQTYQTPLTFLWPEGSRHVLQAYDQETHLGLERYLFSNWTTNKGSIVSEDPKIVIVTANRDITQIDANFTTAYLIRIIYFDCTGYKDDPLQPCPENVTPGKVIVNGNVFTESGSFYGSGSLTLQATPSPSVVGNDSPWIFAGWYAGLGNNSQAFLNGAAITGPMNIYPRFVRGRRVTVNTIPENLQVMVDHAAVVAPSDQIWGQGTTHTLGVTPDQQDLHGKLWVFDTWSDGGAVNHAYPVPEEAGNLSVTANFVPGQRVSFYTNPPGLSLTIDGRSNWLSNNFAWAENSEHTVAAPPTQVDSKGIKYTFVSWSQGGNASQTVTATPDPNGLNLAFTATYEASGRISVVSDTSGIVIQVDGQDCPLPCSIDKNKDASVRLKAPGSVQLSEDSRLDFAGWGDSNDLERTIVTPAAPLTLRLTYRVKNRLTVTSLPVDGANFTTNPASPDRYFDSEARVLLTAVPKTGFRFHDWDGDVSGASTTIAVNMNSPKVVRAVLDRVPALGDAAVQNSAGITPVDGVAPGSIISVYGANLAGELKVGPTSPLSQSLADVTVRVGTRLLPLLFVSPNQINAQLPPDLTEGTYALTVRWEGHPEVTSSFKVVRNAPGLFNNVSGGRAFGLFLHENGDPITTASPAKRTEVVTLLTTGVGPYLQPPPEGFGVPESPLFVLADPVTIMGPGANIVPLYAGVSNGRPGVTAIRFRIGSNFTSGTATEVKLRVLDKDSNTVVLPIE